MSLYSNVSNHEIDEVVADLQKLGQRTDLSKDAQQLVVKIGKTVKKWQSAAYEQVSEDEAAAANLSRMPHVDTHDD